MDVESIRNKVKEYATDAVKCDKLEEYEKAYDLYIKAANQLQLLIKYDQNPYSKKIYVEKAKDYCIRAKEIKEKKLDKKSGDNKKGDKGEETDEEKKKLEEQLSGCIVQEKPNVKWEDVALSFQLNFHNYSKVNVNLGKVFFYTVHQELVKVF